MNEEEAWSHAEKLTLLFGSLAIECLVFVIVLYLGISTYKERKRDKRR
jgi:hypothetical protein